MAKPKILSESAVTMAEVKHKLEEIKVRDGELNFRANRLADYLNQFPVLEPKKAAELSSKITALNIPRMKDEYVAKLVDILPRNINDVKVILQGYSLTLKAEQAKKIVDVVADYLPKED